MELKGCSYARRVAEVNAIYDEYAKTGLSNREIWRRYIYPIYSISEKLSTTTSTQRQSPPLSKKGGNCSLLCSDSHIGRNRMFDQFLHRRIVVQKGLIDFCIVQYFFVVVARYGCRPLE